VPRSWSIVFGTELSAAILLTLFWKSSLHFREPTTTILPQHVTSMAVLIQRIRTLGIRLSEDEYLTLERFCVESGARSISDLARNAIWTSVNRAKQESALASTVSEQSAQVKELEQRLDQLSAEIALLKAREARDQAGASRNLGGTLEEQTPA
jgi:uncharacterized small protein (DUF1192 family)